MKLYQKGIQFIYLVLLISLTVYSFALVDPNLTFINNSVWASFRDVLVQLGYYQRDLSSIVYILIILLLFLAHYYFVKNFKIINIFWLVIPLCFLGLFSYPFLSHDFFSYMFDAKIVTFYHQNPYIARALDFVPDPWLRFLQWTYREYPYGPTFLPLTLIPSFLSFGKFLVDFLLFKGLFLGLFLLGFSLLNKINKKWAVFFATNPLIINEGLVNSHNDFIALSLAIIGICLLNKKEWLGRFSLLLSFGIKYVTFPFIFLSKKKESPINKVVLLLIIAVMIYLSFWEEIQPWYFLALFVLIPYYEKWLARLNIFFAGLLFSYYPYIRFGGWDKHWKVLLKHQIIETFFIINLIFLLFIFLKLKIRRHE